jgi:putative transposase
MEQNCTLESLEGMHHHVHLLVRTDPAASAARFVHQFKATGRILRSEFAHVRSRLSTLRPRSYFVARVGRRPEATTRRYIEELPTSPRQEKRW